jgi:hypothetical protein
MFELILGCKLNRIIDTTNRFQAWAATLNIDRELGLELYDGLDGNPKWS